MRRPTGSAAWPTACAARSTRAGRHLHHRPQRQLHERLRRALQLLRVLSRRSGTPKGTSSGSTRSSARSTRPGARRRPAAAAGRSQPRPPARVVRGSVPGGQAALSGFQAARVVAAGGDPPLAHVAAAGAAGLERLMAAGLDSIPGGGAEILVDRVRKLLNCYSKATVRRVARGDASCPSRRACARRRR